MKNIAIGYCKIKILFVSLYCNKKRTFVFSSLLVWFLLPAVFVGSFFMHRLARDWSVVAVVILLRSVALQLIIAWQLCIDHAQNRDVGHTPQPVRRAFTEPS